MTILFILLNINIENFVFAVHKFVLRVQKRHGILQQSAS